MSVVGADRFETRMMAHVHALFQTAFQLTQSRVEAEAVLHEVYDRAFESFEGEVWSDARVQLFKFLMYDLRSRQRKTLDSNGVRETLGSALSRLPLDLREIVLLVDGQEFSYSQAAEILGLSAEAVADRVVAARERLTEALATTGAL